MPRIRVDAATDAAARSLVRQSTVPGFLSGVPYRDLRHVARDSLATLTGVGDGLDRRRLAAQHLNVVAREFPVVPPVEALDAEWRYCVDHPQYMLTDSRDGCFACAGHPDAYPDLESFHEAAAVVGRRLESQVPMNSSKERFVLGPSVAPLDGAGLAFRAGMLVGATIVKVNSRGRAFVLTLLEDGSALEGEAFGISPPSPARWGIGSCGEMLLDVGPYRSWFIRRQSGIHDVVEWHSHGGGRDLALLRAVVAAPARTSGAALKVLSTGRILVIAAGDGDGFREGDRVVRERDLDAGLRWRVWPATAPFAQLIGTSWDLPMRVTEDVLTYGQDPHRGRVRRDGADRLWHGEESLPGGPVSVLMAPFHTGLAADDLTPSERCVGPQVRNPE